MKLYRSVFRIRFLSVLQYRTAALAGIFTQCFFGFISIMVLEAFIEQRPSAAPMTLDQTVSYIWLGQAFLALAAWSGDIETLDDIRTGGVAYLLCRPLDLYDLWYVRLLAGKTAAAVLRFPPLLVLVFLLPAPYQMHGPASAASFLAFLIALLGLVLLSCAISNMINVLNLWTIAGLGAARLIPALVTLLSGMVIPLAFFPDWLQPLLRALPFAGTVDLPFRLYTGNISAGGIFWCFPLQVFWTVFLVALGRRLVAAGCKRLVIQGG